MKKNSLQLLISVYIYAHFLSQQLIKTKITFSKFKYYRTMRGLFIEILEEYTMFDNGNRG